MQLDRLLLWLLLKRLLLLMQRLRLQIRYDLIMLLRHTLSALLQGLIWPQEDFLLWLTLDDESGLLLLKLKLLLHCRLLRGRGGTRQLRLKLRIGSRRQLRLELRIGDDRRRGGRSLKSDHVRLGRQLQNLLRLVVGSELVLLNLNRLLLLRRLLDLKLTRRLLLLQDFLLLRLVLLLADDFVEIVVEAVNVGK